MIIPDVNLLLYAVTDAFAQHSRARPWWESALSGREDVGIAPCVAFGFVRLATSNRVLATPMSVEAASDMIDQWLARPQVQVLAADGRHLQQTLDLVRSVGAGGNLTTDAQIAAHALIVDGVVASNDADFTRFPGVRTINPLR